MREKITPPSLNQLDKITQPHSLLMGKQMMISNLKRENVKLKSIIVDIINDTGKHKSSTSAKQNTNQGSTSNSQSQERLQTPYCSAQAAADQPFNQGQTAGASNHKQAPFVSPSMQPPQPSVPMQPPLVSPSMYTQNRSSHIQSSGYSQMQSSYPSSYQHPQNYSNQRQSPQANSQLQSPLFPRPMHTANVSTHTQISNAPSHSRWPSHSGHVQVPPSNETRASGVGTKSHLNTVRSQNSYFAPALPQSESQYPQKFSNVYHNNQQFNYHPPNPTQNLPAAYPWASRSHSEVPNESSRALQQEQRRRHPYLQSSNVQHNMHTPTQSYMQSQMQQSISNPSNHRLASTQNHSQLSMMSMSFSQSSHSLQLQSTHYQHSAELRNDFNQVDHLRHPSVPYPSPQYFQQQQQLSQNALVHANQSPSKMLGVEWDYGAGIPHQGKLNTHATNSTQLPLPSTSSQPVSSMPSNNECLQSKQISSVAEENNDNMRLDDYLSELHSELDKQLCENMSTSTQNSISVSEIVKETETYLANPTKLQMSSDICKKESIYCSQSERVLNPPTVSSLSNKSIRYPLPSSLTPPLTPPEKCLIKSEVAANCHEISTSGNHKEKENPPVDEDTLPLNPTTDKLYVAKTSVTELAESLQSLNSTQSVEPVSEISSAFSKNSMSTRHNDGNEVSSSIQSNLHGQNDSIQGPSDVIAMKPKTSLSTSLPQAAVPGSMAFSHQSVSQNTLLSPSFVDRPRMPILSQTAIAIPVIMKTSNDVESSCSTSSEGEKMQQPETSNTSASFVSNSISSGKVSPVANSQSFVSHAAFLKNRKTINKAQTNQNFISVSLLNDSQRGKKYAPITVTKAVQLTEESKVFCYVCEKVVNSRDIFKHLFFGYIKCTRCDAKIMRCIDLEGMQMDKLICNGRKLMTHDFNVWLHSPFDLSCHMWNKSREISLTVSPGKQVLVEGLSRYIQTLSCLESVEPWSTALMRCKKHTSNMLRDLKLDKEMEMPRECNVNLEIAKCNVEKADNLQTLNRTENILNSMESDEGVSETIDKPEKAIKTNVENNGCYEIVSLFSGANENELKSYEVAEDDHVTASIENCDTEVITIYDNPSDCHNTETASNSFDSDCLLETFYTMDHLVNDTEYVDINDACAELQKQSSDIPENNHCSSELSDPCKNGEDGTTLQLMNTDYSYSTDLEDDPKKARNDLNMEERGLIIDIDTVKLSQYKQTQHILEECPMCYELLCPSQFTVNTQSFTISTVCNECGLTITLRLKDRSSKDNLTGAHQQEYKRPGPKIKTKNSRIKRSKVITT